MTGSSLRRAQTKLGIAVVAVGLGALVLMTSGLQAQQPASQQPAATPKLQGLTVGTLGIPAGPIGASWLFGTTLPGNPLPSTLFQIDPAVGVLVPRGETERLTDIAFRSDGRLFAVSFGRLFELNPRTATARAIGPGFGSGIGGVNALASSATGVLYAATTEGQLMRLDSTTGRGTAIGSFGGGLTSSGDIAFAPDGTLYATATTDPFVPSIDLLVRVNLATGAATVVGSIGFDDVFGLAFGPDGALFGAANSASTPLLIRIDTATGAGTTIATMGTSDVMGGLAARVSRSPVEGALRSTGPENQDCLDAPALWTFCQHQSGLHGPGGGLQGSDDTFAWDVNLAGNADQGKPVYALAPGKVVKYAGIVSPVGNDSGAVLIEHSIDGSSCDLTPDNCWWSGYVHLENIQVVENQMVAAGTKLGTIGNTSPLSIPDHLHLVIYEGANVPGGLRSVDTVFHPRVIGRRNDFDADAKADVAVYRPSIGAWFVIRSASGVPTATFWGQPGDMPVAGDYDGDGRVDHAVFRGSSSAWFVLQSTTGTATATIWGVNNDIPVPADYDGDGKTDIAVFRPSTAVWFILPSTTGVPFAVPWGIVGDLPMPADYDGDGKADLAVYRSSTNTWFQLRSATGQAFAVVWGAPGDVPLAGDYDGDGKADPTVFRLASSTWFQLRSTTGPTFAGFWGTPGDLPIVGDYDGDGKDDLTVWRPSTSIWFQLRSSTGTPFAVIWGIGGIDIPIR